MRRRAFNFIALASLIACMLLAWLTWHSYRVREDVALTRRVRVQPKRALFVNRSDWRIDVLIVRGRIDLRSITRSIDLNLVVSPVQREWSMHWCSTRGEPEYDDAAAPALWHGFRNLSIDVIALLFLTAIAPIAWVARRGLIATRTAVQGLRPKHVLNALSLMSLVCFAVAVIGWLCSYHLGVFVRSEPTSQRMMNWQFVNGRVHMRRWSSIPGATPQPVERSGWNVEWIDLSRRRFTFAYEPSDGFEFAGIRIGRPLRDGPRTARDMVFPIWPICLLSAALPARSAIKLLKRWKRPHPGMCPACGYDLRATPERCPECGAKPLATTAR